jgi:2,4-dienoyl-CoA reductase-like NADH-dependent reductase (Old Yellow Enzyme family)
MAQLDLMEERRGSSGVSALFMPASIGTLELKNRMIRAASHEGLADGRGSPTEEQFQFYKGFVDGGIGLVITGYAGVMQNGKSSLYHMTMIHTDELVPAHRAMVEKIHGIGGRIVLQIAHCGRQTLSRETGEPYIVAPSAIPCLFYNELPKKLSEPEIYEIIEAFARAAVRVKTAGYDGVEVHAAHGYLLSSFLSRHSNKRKDRWGGSLENRFRIVGETLRAVRDAVGPHYPVLTKINSYEQQPKGIRADECVRIARLIEQTGCCDAIEVSAGTNENVFIMARGGLAMEGVLKYYRPFCNMPEWLKKLARIFAPPVVGLFVPKFREGYNLDTAAMVKSAVNLPVITVGGMRSKRFMEDAVIQGKTDFLSMARPLLLEPDLANKFKNGNSDFSQCDNCNICVVATDTVPIRCHKDEFKK